MFRKREKLRDAFRWLWLLTMLLCSVWNAINAVTQIETSTLGASMAKQRSQFARGTFGAGAQISKKAFAVAAQMM